MQFDNVRTPEAPVSVMIVEDQTAIRQLLSRYISSTPGYRVVAEASDLDEALQLNTQHHPKIVILDWLLPSGTGLKFLREGLGGDQPPRVLIFSGNTSDAAVREALNNGAKGYLEKSAEFDEFNEAMRAMTEGRVYLSADIADAVHRMSCHPEPGDFKAELSDRELEVLRAVAEGHSSREIAERLGISIRTVGTHRARITQKTGLGSIAQLTMHAVRLGLMDEASVTH